MNISDFLKDNVFKLPNYQPPKLDYKLIVIKQLDKFIDKLEKLLKKQPYFNDFSRFSIESIYNRQLHLTNKIKDALEFYYNGKPFNAFESLNNGLNSEIKDFFEILNIRQLNVGENFYRIRIHKDNFPLPTENFFHIPFEKRGLVKTQRFSIPGFPSLYLASSIYVCWEELNRPNLNDFQAVRLKNISPLNIIDLSPPIVDKQSPYELYKYLMIWPVVLASSIKVRNYEDAFKPEYIIPQLLLQWVREKPDVDGIMYQTTHIDFSSTLSEGEFTNLVLPVKDNKPNGLCDNLKAKFEMTNATSIQLSQCSSVSGTFIFNEEEIMNLNPRVKKIEIIKGKTFPYGFSVLGELERSLNYMTTTAIK